jgi:hypothetical protein
VSASLSGTCPVCGQVAPIVNYGTVPSGSEVGYLGRHRRPGVRASAKCSGSFGPWVEKRVVK